MAVQQATAAIADGRGGFVIGALEVGDPQENEVRVAIRASGVCHTDWDHLSGGRQEVMGHEGAGIVESVGPGVTRVSAGDRVLLNWAIPCGDCFQCRRGAENICEARPLVPAGRIHFQDRAVATSFGLGTMSTCTVVPQQGVVKIDVDIPFASACIIGCGVMTGFGSVINAAKVEEGASVAVLGCGGVGLSVIQGAVHARARQIIAVDVLDSRLQLARRFGATETVLADRADAVSLKAAAQVRKLTEGRGADYAFECTAIPALGSAPLAMVRNGGMAVGVSGIEESIPFDMTLFEWDKLYINPLYGQCRPSVDFPAILRLYQQGRIKLDEMVTRTYPLQELARAFDDMHGGINAKGVLTID